MRLFVWLATHPHNWFEVEREITETREVVRIFLACPAEIEGICGLRSVSCLIAWVIWGQNVSWLHLHFYASDVYGELKAFLELYPRVFGSLCVWSTAVAGRPEPFQGMMTLISIVKGNYYYFYNTIISFFRYQVPRLIYVFVMFCIKTVCFTIVIKCYQLYNKQN